MTLTYEAFIELTIPNAYQPHLEVYGTLEEKDKFTKGLHHKIVSTESELDHPKSSQAVSFQNPLKAEKARDITLISLEN